MSQACKSLLITRPCYQAKKDALFFESKNVNVFMAPMLEIKTLPFDGAMVKGITGYIFTSANAVRIFAEHILERNTQIYCVGNQTARMAHEAGFTNIKSARGNAADLIDLIEQENAQVKGEYYCYIHGKYVTTDIAAALQARGYKCQKVQIYDSMPAENLPQSIVSALKRGDIDAVSFMSVRTARNFIRLVRAKNIENTLESITALCLSPAVVECVRVLNWKSTHVCDHPDGDQFRCFCFNILEDSNEDKR